MKLWVRILKRLEMKRQPRRVKKAIVLPSDAKVIYNLVPGSRIPRLKYHGVDPEHIAVMDMDVYEATGEKRDHGQVFKYKHTIEGKEK